MNSKQTPLMQQYWSIKDQHPDKVVLFRMGDFFEMFHNDAETAAPIIGIALTQRNKKDSDSAKMCGVPHHSIATPIAKLLAAGLKVAICDQIEDPALAKGIVKRAVTRVLTPGMVYDPDTLDELSAHYLAAYNESALALADVSTGSALIYEVENEYDREELLALLRPVELVLTTEQMKNRRQHEFPFRATESEFSSETKDPKERLLRYVEKMQGAETAKTLSVFEAKRRRTGLRLSALTLQHLEVFENATGGRDGTLFAAINRTRSSAGARHLRSWLLAPLREIDEIVRRQNEIEQWVQDSGRLKTFREQMSLLGDIERRLGKVHSSTFNARDLRAIAQSLLCGRRLHEMRPSPEGIEHLSTALHVAEKIDHLLLEELPLAVKEGSLIQEGRIAELDELMKLTQNMQNLLLELENREKEATGISSLKVRYNNVFGFYIELTKTHAHKAPDHYRRKQTLTNAERYTTDELTQLEEKVLSAKSRRDQMEYEIFLGLREEVLAAVPAVLALAKIWSRWDVTSALAWLALERCYRRPALHPEGRLRIELGRHPVIEQTLGTGFVPNTVELNPGEAMLLTGPNMAGKSTIMRQVALIALLAQIGSYIPAESADLPIFDQIFTRIGASDALNEGKSTFMVEMSECAEILRRVTRNSLVVMDEVGRGTSTYDGLSLAQSILEYLLSEKRPYLLFATHYQELAALNQIFPQLKNAHMSIHEKAGLIQFLHTLKDGAANRSYGIHVGKLAGLPTAVTLRAQSLLKNFEIGGAQQLTLGETVSAPVDSEIPPWVEEFRRLNLSQMTPLEALNKLFEWQREASS